MNDETLLRNGIVRDWVKAGFSPEQYQEWAKVGCFDAAKTRELVAHGFQPEDVIENYDFGDGIIYNLSIGYAYCNGDLNIEDVVKLVNSSILNYE